MGGISNTLRQRLAARPAPQVHPEADMLAAYLEQALPAAERDQIVLHLADCAECREIAALSLPIQPEPQLARTLPSRGRLWSLGLRWAGLAATIVIVAALAIKQPWRNSDSHQFVATKTPLAPTVEQPQPQPPNTIAAPEQPVASANNTGASGSALAASVPAPVMRREAPAMDARKSYVNTERFAAIDRDQEKDADDARALPPAPSPQPGSGNSLDSVFLRGSSIQGNSQSDLLAGLNKTGDPGAGLQPGSTPSAGKSSFVTRWPRPLFNTAKKIFTPPFTARGLGGSTMGGPGAFSLSLEKSSSTASAGAMARPAPEKDKVTSVASADAAPSSLKDSAAFTESARAPPAASAEHRGEAEPVQWKAAEGKLLKSTASFDWQEAYPQHNVVFTAVTSRGNDVWAGGTHATLVHSRNGGTDWERVNLGDTAAGDIIRITVEGAKIVVKTSSQQTWSSQDGGRSWTLQASPN